LSDKSEDDVPVDSGEDLLERAIAGALPKGALPGSRNVEVRVPWHFPAISSDSLAVHLLGSLRSFVSDEVSEATPPNDAVTWNAFWNQVFLALNRDFEDVSEQFASDIIRSLIEERRVAGLPEVEDSQSG
jgi:hypothetical protein